MVTRPMRRIRLPDGILDAALKDGPLGRSLVVPVRVDWPELQLTEAQIVANAVARANGQPAPHPEPIITVEIPLR